MRLAVFASAVLLTAYASIDAAPLDAPTRTFEGRDLFDLQWAGDPQIRPDGREVAYERHSFDIMKDQGRSALWMVNVDTGAQVPLAEGAGSHSSPRWSPDGQRLAYVSNVEGEGAQLYVRWPHSGQAVRIANLQDEPGELAWSPDGKLIAFTMFSADEQPKLGEPPPRPEGATWAEPLRVITDVNYRSDSGGYLKVGYTHLYVVSAEGGAPRQLTFGAYSEQGPISWTPDGRFLLLVGNRTQDWRRDPVNTEIYQLALADGALTKLTSRVGPYLMPTVSPDGSRIAFVSLEDQFLGYQNMRLYVMNRDGSNARSLTDALDASIESFRWAADGRSIYAQYAEKALTKFALISLDGRIKPVMEALTSSEVEGPYTGGGFTVASKAVIAFTASTSRRPPNVSVLAGGKVKQLTHLSEDFLAGKTLGEVTSLPVRSSLDQRPIDAWLITPPNFDATKKYPLILEIHGGPFAAYAPVFSAEMQLYAAAGYVVLYINQRGSTSYGEEFANLIHHGHPGNEFHDLMSAVDAAIARGFVDPDNLFVTGISGGGTLTAWTVGRTQRFRAAAAQKPVINWTSFVLTTDIYTYIPKYWFGTLPWESPDVYWQRSPLSLVGAVTTPTLVVVGDKDYRTPLSDSEQYYQALQLRGVPTALVMLPGASHGSSRPSQVAAKTSAILAWFEKYRKPAELQR